ncbi:hypothetical protein EKD04_017430 [Chloroflexales bacterium ZM16-3]|nr:hypothetical protein [Chloroflexales bacterium ZM16-3]
MSRSAIRRSYQRVFAQSARITARTLRSVTARSGPGTREQNQSMTAVERRATSGTR